MSQRALRGTLAALALTLALACRRGWQVGDHVIVEQKGASYGAVIVAVEGPAKFRVRYDGLPPDYDEAISGTRIRGRVDGPTNLPPPAIKGVTRAAASGSSVPIGLFRPGDRVRVEWQGTWYAASILAVLGTDRYRVHYEGYGPEWDENVPIARIERR